MPNKSGKISSAGRGPLIASEREALRVQHRNCAGGRGLTLEKFEARNLARVTTDAALKAPRMIKNERPYFERHPIKPSEGY